jgi:parvulin-like peptidyl-prolyl isomerase
MSGPFASRKRLKESRSLAGGFLNLKRPLLIFTLLATLASAFSQVDPNRVVAVVNGDEIKGQEYYHRMEFLDGVSKRVGSSLVSFPPGFLTIEQLITERLILQLAKDKQVYPTDAEIQAELKVRTDEKPKLLEDWLATGQTMDDLLYDLKVQIAQFKIQTAGINITDQEVSAYYKNNPNFFTTPKRYKLRTIVVTTDDGEKAVDADLAAGKKFEDVAKDKSEDVTKAASGEFGTLRVSAIPEAVRDAITSTKIGQTTAWLKTSGAFAKFLVEDVLPETLEPLSPTLQRKLRRQMMVQHGLEKNNLMKDMAALRAKATIEIKQKEFADAYDKYVQAYLHDQNATPDK